MHQEFLPYYMASPYYGNVSAINNVTEFNNYIFERFLDKCLNKINQNDKAKSDDSINLIYCESAHPNQNTHFYNELFNEKINNDMPWMKDTCLLYLIGTPEDVEDFTLNDSGENRNGKDTTNGKYSTSGYAIYTLRFKVGREASKTRDERVWQNVYIAIPVDGNSTYNQITNIDKIIPTGNFMNTIVKTIANTQIKGSVKSESLI